MTAIQPNPLSPFSVNVTGDLPGAGGSVTLSGVFAGIIPNNTPMYISDGIRVWKITYVAVDANSIQLNNTNLLDGAGAPPSWLVSDYSQLANTTFQVYTGTLVSNGTGGAALSVDIGQFAQAVLYDNGTNGDVTAGDGIWTGQFTTPNNGTVVASANFFGSCSVAGTVALNQNFEGAQTASFDMELPAILTYSLTTTNSNYNNDLYLSSLCQGLSAAVPANVQASSAQARFNFSVNKPNTTVDITLGSSVVPGWNTAMAAAKHLPSFIFPTGATSMNGWSVWVGDDGNQDFCQDGIYSVDFYIHDINNLVGTTITTQIKVVSMKMVISDITLSPAGINTQPLPLSNQLITNIHYSVDLVNDSASSLNSSLQVLGWSDAGTSRLGIDQPQDLFSTVWAMQSLQTLNQSGSPTTLNWSTTDTYDDDQVLANYFTNAMNPGGTGTSLVPPNGVPAQNPPPTYNLPILYLTNLYNVLKPYYPGAPVTSPSSDAGCCVDGMGDVTMPAGANTDLGDGNLGNDWRIKGLTQFWPVGGTSNNPTDLGLYDRNGAQGVTYEWTGPTPAANNYVIDIQSVLTGLGYTPPANPPTTENTPNALTPSAGNQYLGYAFHFWPQSQPELLGEPIQGDGIVAQNSSAIFVASPSILPSGDNAPPQYLSSSPPMNSIVSPNIFSASNPLAVEFQDPTTAFNTSVSDTYITLTGPNGVLIGGTSSTNGGNPNGTLTVYFVPTNPISIGGNYTMQAFTCNTSGLCVQQTIPFSVQDTTPPAINNVVLTSVNGTQNTLSLFQNGAQGPYVDLNQVSVNIQMVNSLNTIDYADSSVSLYQVSGTTLVPVSMVRLASSGGTPTQGVLNYSISSAINYAGLFEVVTQTESEDASLVHFIGPSALGSGGTNTPEFTTQFCSACVGIPYSNNPSVNRSAISGTQPITITSQVPSVGTVLATAAVTVAKPASLPAFNGFTFLPTAANNNQMQFYQNNTPLTTPLVWTYPITSPLIFQLYYDSSDVAATSQTGTLVQASALEVVGYDGSVWHQVANAAVPLSPTAAGDYAFSVPVPDGTASYVYYAIAYASNLSNSATAVPTAGAGTPTAVATATPISFLSTRAFNPWNSNPIYQKASFYYGTVAPQTMEARIYDTSGHLIRDLTLGNGISASDSKPDPGLGTEYYFTWDGTNDAGTVVHNGIYLVRWNEVGIDNSHNTQTRPVALIK